MRGRGARLIRLIGATVVAVVCSVACGVAFAQPADRRALQAAVDGFAAVDLTGRSIAMRDLKGRVVVLDFWATWCAPCLAEIPTLREVRRLYSDQVVIVGVSLDVQDRAAFITWLRRQAIEWPQVFDGRGWASPTIVPFELTGIPFNVLVGADGRVVGVNVKGERLLRSLEVLLGGRERSCSPCARPDVPPDPPSARPAPSARIGS